MTEVFVKAATSQGKMRIPVKVQDFLNLEDGDMVVFDKKGKELVFKKGKTVPVD